MGGIFRSQGTVGCLSKVVRSVWKTSLVPGALGGQGSFGRRVAEPWIHDGGTAGHTVPHGRRGPPVKYIDYSTTVK